MHKLGIGIPFYNELSCLEEIVREIENHPELPIDFYLLDNGSNNGSIDEFLADLKISNVRILRIRQNIGFGGGIKYLIKNIENEYIGWMPGNGKVKISSLSAISNEILENAHLEAFKAKRCDRKLADSIKTFIAGIALSTIFFKNLLDSGGTPTVIKRSYASYFLDGPDDFSFEAFATFILKAHKLKLIRKSVPYGIRVHGKSHWQNGLMSEIKLFCRIVSQRNEWKHLL